MENKNQNENRPIKCPGCDNEIIVDYLMAPDRFHGKTIPFRLVCCQTCSLVWLVNPPKSEEMAMHYSKEYDRSIAAAGDSSPSRGRDRKQTLTQYKQSGAILDLGCSAGSFLKTMGSKEWELYGIDMSSESARRAQAESGAKVFVGDILDAPFHDSTFDAITCFHVFEHLYKPREVLSRVSDWLKPDGIFYMLVPNIDSAGAHIFGSYWYALELPRHVFHYSPKSLIAMAQSVGLEVLSVTTHREIFIEQSTRYIIDDMLRGLGTQRVPLANAQQPGIIFRLVRKAFRLTMLPFLTGLASFGGDGESIHAVFQKRSN
jgi:2-polyprenyl-3-methyl-5-hydroxy-6-metoxy-1,4-benzoquinol methylase